MIRLLPPALLLASLLTACGGAPPVAEPVEAVPDPPAEESVKPGINDTFLDPDLDVDAFVQRFEVESREIYVERKAIAATLGLQPGMAVADVGAGTGLFEPAFSKSVGADGTVYAVDLSPGMLEHLRARKTEEIWSNVEIVECTEASVSLPADSVDRFFICDTYHHFEYPRSTMLSVHTALRDGGEVIVVDFERIPGVSREWILGHVRAGKDTVTAEIESFGFRLVEEVEVEGLEENYLLRFVKS